MNAVEWLDRVDALAREGTAPVAVPGGTTLAEYRAMHRAREEACAAVPAMSAALRAVLDLHRQHHHVAGHPGFGLLPDVCTHDARDWPCPTVRAVTEALA